jgi:hypothetical protein
MQKEDQWNVLLKLKSLPFGSVHCIANSDLDNEVNEIVNNVLSNGCMQDTDVHNRFCKKYIEWIQSTKNNTITGLEKFSTFAFSNGTTEAFDKFYLKHSQRRLRYFKGEYMYHLAIGKAYFQEVALIEDDCIQKNDVVVFSLPFADNGSEHPRMQEILTSCEKLGVPVLVDCCYFGVCAGVTFDFSYNCIEEVVFSLSKNFPVQHLRIGMRLSKTDSDDPLLVYNKNNYVNRLGAAVGEKLIEKYSSDYNYNAYRSVQEQFSKELGVTPTKCVFFATSSNSFKEYNRGTDLNRLCFSKYLNSGVLPLLNK